MCVGDLAAWWRTGDDLGQWSVVVDWCMMEGAAEVGCSRQGSEGGGGAAEASFSSHLLYIHDLLLEGQADGLGLLLERLELREIAKDPSLDIGIGLGDGAQGEEEEDGGGARRADLHGKGRRSRWCSARLVEGENGCRTHSAKRGEESSCWTLRRAWMRSRRWRLCLVEKKD